jgi:hypothetical protein
MANQNYSKTINGVEVNILSWTSQFTPNKKQIEVYTNNDDTKLFMEVSNKTGKSLQTSMFIDGEYLLLDKSYEFGMALDVFTNLVSKFSKKHNEQQYPIGFNHKKEIKLAF